MTRPQHRPLRAAASNSDQTDAAYRQLLDEARAALEFAWCPYSKFSVGAALLTESGQVFAGCNVENSEFAGTICAERTALVKAVSEGHRRFAAIAVVSGKAFECWPCGTCRQFMSEFGKQLVVIVETAEGEIRTATLESLLPGLSNL